MKFVASFCNVSLFERERERLAKQVTVEGPGKKKQRTEAGERLVLADCRRLDPDI